MSKTLPAGSIDDDILVIGGEDITIDLGNYGAAQSVYTIDSMLSDTITFDPNTVYTTTGTSGSNYNYSIDSSWGYNNSANVEINTDGVNIKDDADLKIGNRSMKEFMDKVEDQLAILRPAPELEENWEKLKELRRQYEECKQDILEKEKIMKILKEK